MKLPQTPPLKSGLKSPNQKIDAQSDSRITPQMRKAAEGLEAVFTQEMVKAMRGTVEESEFSLHNSATDLYQGMLDEEYSDIAAKQNSLGLSNQIIDYWLRSQPSPQYNNSQHHQPVTQPVARGTGGTDENQSSE
jgi:Rod binding domain-containing protein